jgi:hypothetical protein
MGTWGHRTFEDDTACDWLDDLAASDGAGFLERTLLGEAGEEGDLDSEQGVHILAAAEIVYGLLNGPREELPEEAVAWIKGHQHVDAACLKPVCERQLGRVLGDGSELRQRWQENKELYSDWKAHVEILRNGLKD